jgi:hypothetical protein
MNMIYAIVPVFWADNKTLFREFFFSYVVSDQKHLVNHPIYVSDEYIGCGILM